MTRVRFEIEGMKELDKKLKKLGQVPQKAVTPSAKKGMNIALKDARANAPFETGDLTKGIIIKPERSRKKGKKVYRVVIDSAMNDVFQKLGKDGKVSGYYPVSMEYGFIQKDGQFNPGHKYMRNALTENKTAIEKTIVSEMTKRVDKIISEG